MYPKYITTIIRTPILYLVPPISDHSHTHLHADTSLWTKIEQASILKNTTPPFWLNCARLPPSEMTRVIHNHFPFESFLLLLPYVLHNYSQFQDQHFYASTLTTAQSHTLPHLLHFTHTSPTYAHNSFCYSLPTNYVPHSVWQYEQLASLSCN